MTRRAFDVDIDVKSGTKKDAIGVRSFVYNKEKMKLIPHPSGYFLPSEHLVTNDVPIDPETGLASIESKEGESYGFFKVDLLTNTSYDNFKSKKEVLDSMDFENFDWDVFLDKEVVETLPHIGQHFSLVRQLQPQSVEDLADILALIRPGKIELLDDYIENKERTRKRLYKRPSNGGMYFKKSHSVSYAVMILVTLNKKQKASFDFGM